MLKTKYSFKEINLSFSIPQITSRRKSKSWTKINKKRKTISLISRMILIKFLKSPKRKKKRTNKRRKKTLSKRKSTQEICIMIRPIASQ